MATVAEIFESMDYGPAPEADKPALEWLARHREGFGHFIDGRWTKAGELRWLVLLAERIPAGGEPILEPEAIKFNFRGARPRALVRTPIAHTLRFRCQPPALDFRRPGARAHVNGTVCHESIPPIRYGTYS